MTHEELPYFLEQMLPEEYLLLEELLDFHWTPDNLIHDEDTRLGIGGRFKLSVLRPLDGIPAHRLDALILIYAYSGTVDMKIGAAALSLSAGQIVLVSQNTEISVAACSPESIGIHFAMKPELISQQSGLVDLPSVRRFLQPDAPDYMIFQTERITKARWYIQEMCCEHFDPDRHTYFMIPALLSLLLSCLDRCAEQPGSVAPNRLTVDEILRYIRTNFASVTLDSTAKRFGFSPNYLSHLLKITTGRGFQETKQSICIAQSARMLTEQRLTVAQIAQAVGIGNITHFYSLFYKQYGMTPAKYRKNAVAAKKQHDSI